MELEGYTPICPPEVRETADPLRLIEFYEPLGVSRPELRMFERMLNFLKECAPLCVVSATFDYRAATDVDPPLLVGNLIITTSLDFG